MDVDVISPNGDVQTKTTILLTSQGIVGQAVFQVTTTGTYKVRLAHQPAVTPFISTTILSSSQSFATVPLQLNGATLTLTIADAKAQSFTAATDVHAYNLTYANTGSFNSDLTLVASGLPTGWNMSAPTATISAGHSVPIYIYNSSFSFIDPAIITINGYAGSSLVVSTPLSLAKDWGLGLRLTTVSGYTGISSCPGAYKINCNISSALASRNVDAATLASNSITGTYTVQAVAYGDACHSTLVTLPAVYNLGSGATVGYQKDFASGQLPYTVSGVFSLYANGLLVVNGRPFSATYSGGAYGTSSTDSY